MASWSSHPPRPNRPFERGRDKRTTMPSAELPSQLSLTGQGVSVHTPYAHCPRPRRNRGSEREGRSVGSSAHSDVVASDDDRRLWSTDGLHSTSFGGRQLSDRELTWPAVQRTVEGTEEETSRGITYIPGLFSGVPRFSRAACARLHEHDLYQQKPRRVGVF